MRLFLKLCIEYKKKQNQVFEIASYPFILNLF